MSGLIRTHRKQLGSIWRKLNPGQQALAVLVYLRKGEPFAEVEHRRCALLHQAKRDSLAYVIIDGTLIPIDRVAADRPFYSGKYRMHGMNLQVIASPDGTNLWVSGDLPGATHDTAAARIWQILAALRDSPGSSRSSLARSSSCPVSVLVGDRRQRWVRRG